MFRKTRVQFQWKLYEISF